MDVVGYLAGLFTLIGYLPQTIKTIRTKHAKDLSLATFVIVGISAILWIVYGLGNDKPAIWITNSVVAIATTIVVVIKFREP
jgi:MtN3 and saliva related transmembrane protein